VCSARFFDAFSTIHPRFSDHFTPEQHRLDAQGAPHAVHALAPDDDAYLALQSDILSNAAHARAARGGQGNLVSQMVGWMRDWVIPLNAFLFSTTFFVNHAGQGAEQARTVQWAGLGLLAVAAVMAAVIHWRTGRHGPDEPAHSPRWLSALTHRPAMIVVFCMGVVLCVVSVNLEPARAQSTERVTAP
jgi:hypothetical protein